MTQFLNQSNRGLSAFKLHNITTGGRILAELSSTTAVVIRKNTWSASKRTLSQTMLRRWESPAPTKHAQEAVVAAGKAKVATILTLVGPETSRLLKNLVSPQRSADLADLSAAVRSQKCSRRGWEN